MREVFVDWQAQAPRMLSSFRRSFASASDVPDIVELVQELERVSPDFKAWWREHDVHGSCLGLRSLNLGALGEVAFEHATLTVDENRHLSLVVYAPAPDDARAAEAANGWRAGPPRVAPENRRGVALRRRRARLLVWACPQRRAAPQKMSKNSLSRRQALALLAVVVLAWGFTWVVSKLLLHMTPLWAVAARSAARPAAIGAGAAPRGLAGARQHSRDPQRRPVAHGRVRRAGEPGTAACAGRTLGAGHTTPLWVIPAARLFLGEPIGRRAGLLLGLAGLILIFNPLAFDWSDRAAIFGNALVLLAALCWAANIVYVRAHRWVTPPFELAFWQALLATVVLSAAASTEGAPRVIWGADLAWLLGYGGVFGIAVAYWAAVNVNRSPAGRRHVHRPAGRARVRPVVLGGGAGRAPARCWPAWG